jgi:hypothetical protein
MSTRPPSPQSAETVMDRAVQLAEQRGAARVRAQVQDILADSRRIVRMGDHQIEVVEVAAIAEIFEDEEE